MEKTTLQFSVSDFVALTNQTLEYAYPSVRIEGEVASFKVNQNKYIFFDIKDQQASVGCFMMVWQLRMPIEDGMKVVIEASPKLTNWGKFSLTVRSITPSGEGSIKKSFELLQQKLQKEGLFSLDRKRLLPSAPQRIAVISSTQAAGYADFMKIINDRWGGIKIDVANVQVQGEPAAAQIIRALHYFNELDILPEVIVIIRGGGSADDLNVFNDEQLVRAIAASRVPTLVGIGHEVDETLADLAADVRAATPSNAAQIIVPDRLQHIRYVRQQLALLMQKTNYAIEQKRAIISQQLLQSLRAIDAAHDKELRRISAMRQLLAEFDPQKVLKRGYAVVRGDIKQGKEIIIETTKNIITAEVKDVRKK